MFQVEWAVIHEHMLVFFASGDLFCVPGRCPLRTPGWGVRPQRDGGG